jgi:hypothetical protein
MQSSTIAAASAILTIALRLLWPLTSDQRNASVDALCREWASWTGNLPDESSPKT